MGGWSCALPRFARKIDNVRRVFAVHAEYCGANMAWHWRRWLALEDEAAIADEFMRQQIGDADLEALRAQGFVSSLREWFAAGSGVAARAG